MREAKVYQFNKLDVMDVGTGIQSYILHLLKFKTISHFDINYNAIENLNNLKIPNLVSVYKDLNYEKINKKFDLIYLYGVLHHIKNYEFFLNKSQYMTERNLLNLECSLIHTVTIQIG